MKNHILNIRKLLLLLCVAVSSMSAMASFSLGTAFPASPPLEQMENNMGDYQARNLVILVTGNCTNVGTASYAWQLYNTSTMEVYSTNITTTNSVPWGYLNMSVPLKACPGINTLQLGVRVNVPGIGFEYNVAPNLVVDYRSLGTNILPSGSHEHQVEVCPGEAIPTLDAMGCGTSPAGYTFDWQEYAPLSGYSSLGVSTSTYTPTAGGKFRVLVTRSFSGTSYTEAIEYDVTVVPDLEIEVSGYSGYISFPYFPGVMLDITAAMASYYNTSSTWFHTFQWYRNDQIIPGATSTSYSPSSTGHYKLVATGACGQISSNDYFLYDESICNLPGGYPTLGNSGSVTSLTGTNNFAGQHILGMIRISSGTTTFAWDDVIIDACAGFVVSSGATLVIDHCILTSCTQWAGIKVEAGGSLVVNESSIRNAYLGILVDGTANLSVQNADFRDCHTSIYISGKSSPGLVNIESSFFSSMDRTPGLACNQSTMGPDLSTLFSYVFIESSENIFLYDNWFYGWQTGQSMISANKSPAAQTDFYGLQLQGCDAIAADQNIFFDIFKAGLFNETSANTSLQGNYFQPFSTPSGSPADVIGRGIWNKESAGTFISANTFIQQFAAIYEESKTDPAFNSYISNSFTDNGYSLLAENTDAIFFRSNTISSGNVSITGVELNNCSRMRVEENEFTNQAIGIRSKETFPYSYTDNAFQVNNSMEASGIEVYKNNYTTEDEISKISLNTFSATTYGLVVAPEMDPKICPAPSQNELQPGSEKQQVIISCNAFYENQVAIMGTGAILDQYIDGGGNAYATENQFFSNIDWDIIWDPAVSPNPVFVYSSAPNVNPNASTTKLGVMMNGSINAKEMFNRQDFFVDYMDCNWKPQFVLDAESLMKKLPSGLKNQAVPDIEISVMPTLVENTITIRNKADMPQQVTVSSISGQNLLEAAVRSGDSIDLGHLSSGVYLVHIRLENGTVHTERVIKR